MKGVVRTIIIVLFSSWIYAGNNKWTTTGPYGGSFRSFAFHPQISSLIFASGGAGVFRSRNSGRTWERLQISPSDWRAYPLRIHSKDPNKVLAATYAVFSSTDQGNSWENISGQVFESGDLFFDLEFDPEDSQILYGVSYDHGVLKSLDGGKSWSTRNTGLKLKGPEGDIPQLEVDPANRNVAYVSLPSRMVFKTTNGGDSWQAVTRGLKITKAIHGLTIDPKDPQTAYVNGWDGVFKTTNGGAEWFDTGCSCGSQGFAIDSRNPQNLYSGGSGGGLLKSEDGGMTWAPLQPASPDSILGIGVHPKDGNLVLLGNFGTGIQRSLDGGASWRLANNHVDANGILHLESHSGRPDHLFAVGAGDQLHVSRNAGKKWEIDTTFPDGNHLWVRNLKIHPQNADLLAIARDPGGGGEGAVAVSTDGGSTWEERSSYESSDLIAFNPADQNILYQAPWTRDPQQVLGFARSTDQGKTWKLLNSGLSDKDVTAIAVDAQRGSNLLVGTRSGKIFKSVNGGNNWKNSSAGLNGDTVFSIAIDPTNSNIVYASTNRVVYKSTDAGKKWDLKNQGLPANSAFSFVGIDPSNPRTVFAAGEAGLFISTDAAASWSAFDSNGLGDTRVNDFLIDPSDSNRFLIGAGRGVFSYTRAGSLNGPRIDQILPAGGKAGDVVTVNGGDFGALQGDSKIFFAGIDAGPAQSWSDTSIKVQVPAGARTGPVTVTVVNRKSNAFEFIVLPTSGNIEPASGPSGGGTRVAILAPSGISGAQFNVLFGSTLARDVRFVSPNIIVCITPAGNGTVDVSVTSSAVVAKVGTFTYR